MIGFTIINDVFCFKLLEHVFVWKVCRRLNLENAIGDFTVVCLVTWPRIENEAWGDLVLIQTSLFFICRCKLVSIRRE